RAILPLPIVGQQDFAPLTQILDDRAGLENPDLAVAEAGDLVERLLAQIFQRAFLVEQADAIVQARLLDGPADAQVADYALSELGHPPEGGDLDCRIRIDWHVSLLLPRLRRRRARPAARRWRPRGPSRTAPNCGRRGPRNCAGT